MKTNITVLAGALVLTGCAYQHADTAAQEQLSAAPRLESELTGEQFVARLKPGLTGDEVATMTFGTIPIVSPLWCTTYMMRDGSVSITWENDVVKTWRVNPMQEAHNNSVEDIGATRAESSR